MPVAYILLMMIWTPSGHTAGSISSARFASKPACERAAAAAKQKFEGWQVSFYHVCEPEGDRE
jgi:hypothetical protein